MSLADRPEADCLWGGTWCLPRVLKLPSAVRICPPAHSCICLSPKWSVWVHWAVAGWCRGGRAMALGGQWCRGWHHNIASPQALPEPLTALFWTTINKPDQMKEITRVFSTFRIYSGDKLYFTALIKPAHIMKNPVPCCDCSRTSMHFILHSLHVCALAFEH